MKIKRILIAVLALLQLTALMIPVNGAEYNAPSYILMEADTGTVLLEENADTPLPPASVTKIMTVLLVMDAIADGKIKMDEMVSVSEYAASMGGSQVYLEPGEEMTVGELLKCVVVASANDGAVALAEKVAGSEEAFVKMMNERATGLGAKNTVFLNTNGLDDGVDGHVMSARDIAIISRELITKYPSVLELSSIWMDTIRDGAFGLTNTNRLIRFYRGANGLKTGSTAKAKFCMSATAERDGMTLIAVVMAAPTRDDRNETAKKLLDYGFAGWETVTAAPESLPEMKIVGGVTDSLKLSCESERLLLTKGAGTKLKCEIILPEYLSAPIHEGDEIGTAEFSVDGEAVAKLPIKAAEGVEKIGYFSLLARFLKRMLLA